MTEIKYNLVSICNILLCISVTLILMVMPFFGAIRAVVLFAAGALFVTSIQEMTGKNDEHLKFSLFVIGILVMGVLVINYLDNAASYEEIQKIIKECNEKLEDARETLNQCRPSMPTMQNTTGWDYENP